MFSYFLLGLGLCKKIMSIFSHSCILWSEQVKSGTGCDIISLLLDYPGDSLVSVLCNMMEVVERKKPTCHVLCFSKGELDHDQVPAAAAAGHLRTFSFFLNVISLWKSMKRQNFPWSTTESPSVWAALPRQPPNILPLCSVSPLPQPILVHLYYKCLLLYHFCGISSLHYFHRSWFILHLSPPSTICFKILGT